MVEQVFDDFVEKVCAKFYAPWMGRPGLDSERGIAGRTDASLALRDFLGLSVLQKYIDKEVSMTKLTVDELCNR